MPESDYTAQDLRIYQYRLDGATDEWIEERLSVDSTAINVARNRMTRAIASWFDIDHESVDAFVESNLVAVLSRVMSALEERSRRVCHSPPEDDEDQGGIDDVPSA